MIGDLIGFRRLFIIAQPAAASTSLVSSTLPIFLAKCVARCNANDECSACYKRKEAFHCKRSMVEVKERIPDGALAALGC